MTYKFAEQGFQVDWLKSFNPKSLLANRNQAFN